MRSAAAFLAATDIRRRLRITPVFGPAERVASTAGDTLADRVFAHLAF
jgi:hypothetical protein